MYGAIQGPHHGPSVGLRRDYSCVQVQIHNMKRLLHSSFCYSGCGVGVGLEQSIECWSILTQSSFRLNIQHLELWLYRWWWSYFLKLGRQLKKKKVIFILVHLPGLWGFWDGAAASYVWNRNVLLSVAKGWFTGIVMGVIFPFVSSSGIFCPCSKQKINFKNPVEPVTFKSSGWGEVHWKLKQFISGVGEAGVNAEV